MQQQFQGTHYSFRIGDNNFRLASQIGVARADEANTALVQAARRVRGNKVFVTGPACAASALWAAAQGAQVSLWTEHVAQADVIRQSFQANKLAIGELHINADFEGLAPRTFDQALIHLNRGKVIQEEQLQLAAALVNTGGQVVFVGAKNEGIKGALSIAQNIFGEAGITVKKKGYHAGIAFVKSPTALPVPHALITHIDVDGHPTTLIAYPGAFAPDRLDVGASALIQGMHFNSGDEVLDLGCGTGLAGLTALRRGAVVTFTDVSARAVASTQATLSANGYANAPVHHGFGANAFGAGTFDCVITNPPFHTGHDRDYALPQLFVSEAARVLKAGGIAYFVTNNFLKYEPWLDAAFQKIDVPFEDSRFRVWKAVK